MTTTIVVALALTSAIVYLFFLMSFERASRRAIRADDPVRTEIDASHWPGVTILKPCAGADEDLEACIESFCNLAYPEYQLILGVRERTDAAVPVIEKVRARYPHRDIQLVVVSALHPSPKISTMAGMERFARHEFYWLSDSNTRVHPDTLNCLMASLLRPGVGMVVSPVAGVGEGSLGSALDNLEIGAWIAMGTFAVHGVTGLVAGPGKSCAIHRTTLEGIGGWDKLGQYFGEDTVLMSEVRKSDLRLVLGAHVVAHPNRRTTMAGFVDRQIRWLQIRFCLYPFSIVAEMLLSPWIMGLAGFVISPGWLTFSVMLLGAFVQIAGDVGVMNRLRGTAFEGRWFFAILLRPILILCLAVRACISSRVRWRGREAWMGPGSSILSESPWKLRLRGVRRAMRSPRASEGMRAEVPVGQVVPQGSSVLR